LAIGHVVRAKAVFEHHGNYLQLNYLSTFCLAIALGDTIGNFEVCA